MIRNLKNWIYITGLTMVQGDYEKWTFRQTDLLATIYNCQDAFISSFHRKYLLAVFRRETMLC